MKNSVALGLLALSLGACATQSQQPNNASAEAAASASTPATPAAPARSIGNGQANWIITEGARREGATYRFPEVQIDGNGWLVMHPFENGKANGDIYVGATYVSSGTNYNVAITVDDTPAAGDMFIVMLHRDIDEDKNFDFVFVGDTGHVEDKAVFEGNTMIGHAYRTPE